MTKVVSRITRATQRVKKLRVGSNWSRIQSVGVESDQEEYRGSETEAMRQETREAIRGKTRTRSKRSGVGSVEDEEM